MALKYSDIIKKDRPPLFHKVDDYLAWLLSEKDHLTKVAKKYDRKCYEIVQGIVGSLMVAGFKTSREFQDNIDPLDDWSWKVAMKNVIRKTTLNNYVIRLFLINKGPLGAIQMEFGEGSEISSGEVNLVLTQSLPQTDRTAVRAQMADYVNKEGQVSAKKILTWLYPVLETYFTNLSGKQAFGYTLNCLMTSNISKFCVMLTCVPIHNKQGKILTMHLNFEVATVIKYIPIHFQHPYPRYKPHSTLGHQMSNDVKKSVDDNKMKVVVYCKVGKPSPKANSALDKQPKMSQAKQKRYQNVTTFKRVWTLDFSNIEQSMLRKCMKMDLLKPCTEALTLYDVISNKGKMLLPQLESNIKTTILLWLIRKHANDLKTGKEWFLTLVQKVTSIMKSGFCPSFCQPNINIWKSGKASNGSWKVLALEAFTESLKDTYGAAMVKHSVGIYGRNTTITTNFDIDAFMQDLAMKHTKVNDKNSPPLKVKRAKTGVDFKDTTDSTQRSSQVKSNQDQNIDNKTNRDKTPNKIAAGKTSNQRRSQTKSQVLEENIGRKTKEEARNGNKVPVSKNNEKKNRRDTLKPSPGDEQKQSGEETNEPKSYSKESFEESTVEDFEESIVETLSKDISLPNPVENSDGFPSIVSNDKHDPNSKDGEFIKRNTPIIIDTDIQSREKSKSSVPSSTDNTPLSYASRTTTPLVPKIPTPIEKRPTSRSSFEGFPPINRETSGSVASFESNNGKGNRTKRPVSTDERIKSMDNVGFPSIHCEKSQHESVASFDSYKDEQNEMDQQGSSVKDCFEENGLPGISPITENTLTDLDLSNANEKTGTSFDTFQGKDPHHGNSTNIRTSTSNAETSFKVNSYDHKTPSANALEESCNERSHTSEYANSKSHEDLEESETGKNRLDSWNSFENGDEQVDQPNNMQNLKNSREETAEIQHSSSMESSDETITHPKGSTPESAERLQSSMKETETKPSSESKLEKTKPLSESKQRLEKIKLNKARRKKRNALIGYI